MHTWTISGPPRSAPKSHSRNTRELSRLWQICQAVTVVNKVTRVNKRFVAKPRSVARWNFCFGISIVDLFLFRWFCGRECRRGTVTGWCALFDSFWKHLERANRHYRDTGLAPHDNIRRLDSRLSERCLAATMPHGGHYTNERTRTRAVCRT